MIGPDELAEALGVSVRTVYSWRATGYGPRGFRVGRHVRYDMGDVEMWVDGQRDREPTREPAA